MLGLVTLPSILHADDHCCNSYMIYYAFTSQGANGQAYGDMNGLAGGGPDGQQWDPTPGANTSILTDTTEIDLWGFGQWHDNQVQTAIFYKWSTDATDSSGPGLCSSPNNGWKCIWSGSVGSGGVIGSGVPYPPNDTGKTSLQDAETFPGVTPAGPFYLHLCQQYKNTDSDNGFANYQFSQDPNITVWCPTPRRSQSVKPSP